MKFADRSRLTVGGKDYLPLMQGGMGVDISTAALALEVARLGGVGHISDAMAPWLSDKYLGTRIQATKSKGFREEITPAGVPGAAWNTDVVYDANKRAAAYAMERKRGNGAIFVNVMEKLGMGNPSGTLQARLRGVLDGGIDGITLSAGLHNGSLKLIEDHPRFRDAAIGIIVSSVRALAIFLRSAQRVNRLPDYIVVEGPLAGGHLGFGEDWREHDLETIVREVVAYLEEAELKIPVIAAGGVFTGADAMGMCDAGATAVQVATRFTISKECGLPEKVKHEYIRAKEEDVEVNSSSPTGYLMRMLKQSPSLHSNISPNCAALGYMLDRDGKCSYQQAYVDAPVNAEGVKLPVVNKMCICYHFMKHNCYTCGHNVYRLKETVEFDAEGKASLPTAEIIFNDYLYSPVTKEWVEVGELISTL